MKKSHIIILVIGTSLTSFILSVVFSTNMVSISPKDLAKVIKKDPVTFIDAIKVSSEAHQKKNAEKAFNKQLKNPAKIPIKGRVVFGNTKAPVTIVEYSDFQCPYCAKAAHSMKQIREKYNGKVKLVYKHFPLSFHPFAKPASEYFEAIAFIDHSQAKKFHDSIFDNFSLYAKLKGQREIHNKLRRLVKKMGLDIKAVKNNMKKARKIVQQDISEAEKLNVRGTPSFFVNGVNSNGRVEYLIDRFLKKL